MLKYLPLILLSAILSFQGFGQCTTPAAGPDESICESENLTLSANEALGVETGSWSTAGDGSFSPNVNEPDAVYQPGTNDKTSGSVVLTWEITDGVCVDNTDEMVLSIDQTPTVAEAGPSMTACESAQPIVLSANPPIVGMGSWSLVVGSGDFQNIFDPTTTVNNLSNGQNILRWTISNGSCPEWTDDVNVELVQSYSPSVTISVDKNPSCFGDDVTFTATATNEGSSPTYEWFVNGTIIQASSSSFFSANLFGGQQVHVEMTSSEPCAWPNQYTSSIIAMIVENQVNPITHTSSTIICPNGSTTILSATNYGSTKEWYMNDELIPNENSQELIVVDSGYYYLIEDNGICPANSTDSIHITIDSNIPVNFDSLFVQISLTDDIITECESTTIQEDTSYGNGYLDYYVNGVFIEEFEIEDLDQSSDIFVVKHFINDCFPELDSAISNTVHLTILEDYCGVVEGQIIIDEDANCIKNGTDYPLEGKLVRFEPTDKYAITDSNGYYQTTLNLGSYTATVVPVGNEIFNCPSNGENSFSIVNSSDTVQNVDFFMDYTPITEIGVYLYGTTARPGRSYTEYMNINNTGTDPEDVVIKYVPDDLFEVSSTDPTYNYLSGDTLVWEWNDFAPESKEQINIKGSVSTVATFGDVLKSYAWVTPVLNDIDPFNNVDSLLNIVRTSYDPNDKQVWPSDDGFIGEVDSGSVFKYMIRFQNTGNDTAFKIVVTDTITDYLDISTLRLGGTSHPSTFDIAPGNVFRWTFDNILLPDSTKDEANSHGAITFYMEHKKDLIVGTNIENNVDIYFDFNIPVRTNTTSSTLKQGLPAGVNPVVIEVGGVHLQPNPATDYLLFSTEISGGYEIEIYNQIGALVETIYSSSPQRKVNVQGLTTGIYIFRIVDGSQLFTGKFVKE